jgi:hypothetical protein
MVTKKIKFKFNRILFYVDSNVVHYTHTTHIPYLKLDHFNTISVITQFIEQINLRSSNTIHCEFNWQLTDDNCGAIVVYISSEFGEPINQGNYEMIQEFCNALTVGYNDTNDNYIYYDNLYKTETGTPIHMSCAHVTVVNKPLYGSIPYIINIIKNSQLPLQDMYEVLLEHIEEDKLNTAIDIIKQHILT